MSNIKEKFSSKGEYIADVVVNGMGSWSFILVQTALVLLWIGVNLWLLSHPYDPYPFIVLNLLFSTQAAYSSPLILMASNRQSQKDKKRDDLEALEVQKIYQMHTTLLKMNQQQLDILKLLHDQSK